MSSTYEGKENGDGEMRVKGKIKEKNEKVQKDLLNILHKHYKLHSLTDSLNKHWHSYYVPGTVF